MILSEYIIENKSAFITKVKNIAKDLNIKADWLMGVMYFESALNHRAVNYSTNATGLIQFMPSTAQGLGTTTSQLLNMSNIQQLDYVYKYFKPYKNKIKEYTDLHLVTFFPLAIKKNWNDNHALESSGLSAEIVAKYNAPLDTNKDGKIKVGEYRDFVRNKVGDKIGTNNLRKIERNNTIWYLFICLIILISIGVYFYLKNPNFANFITKTYQNIALKWTL